MKVALGGSSRHAGSEIEVADQVDSARVVRSLAEEDHFRAIADAPGVKGPLYRQHMESLILFPATYQRTVIPRRTPASLRTRRNPQW
jgi:hypothetical protein